MIVPTPIPRFGVLGRALRCSAGEAAWRCMRLWSRVTAQQSERFRPAHVAVGLGCREERVAEAVAASEIGVVLDSGEIELQLRDVFGGIEWLGDLRDSAPVGGKVRAAGATRNRDGTFAARDLIAETLDVLAAEPLRRSDLRRRLQCQKQALGRVVRGLLEAGELIELDDGCLALPDASPDACGEPGTVGTVEPGSTAGSMGTAEPVPPRFHGDRGTTAEPSAPALARAPAPALAPAPVRESTSRAHARARAALEPPRNQDREPVEPTTVEPLEPAAPEPPPPELSLPGLDAKQRVTREQRRPMARKLWAYQNQLRKRLDPEAPELPVHDMPGGPMDTVILRLALYPPATCKHALDVFAAEGECIRDEGGDPLEFLNGRTNWKREQFERAAGTTIAAVRKRHQRRHKNGKRATPNEPSRAMKKLS